MTHANNTKLMPKSQELFTLVNESYRNTRYQLHIYEHSIRFIFEQRPPSHKNLNPGKRGEVAEFSRNSRKRLIRLFASVNMTTLSPPVFITLTYHHGHKKNPRIAVKHLNTWLQHIRNRVPRFFYIWRLELQKRGAPHFHIICFFEKGNLLLEDDAFISDLERAWHRIADPKSRAHRKFGFKKESLSSYKKAFAYLSKYVAKESNETKFKFTGRRWGKSANLPVNPLFSLCLTEDVYLNIRKWIKKIVSMRKKVSKEFLEYLSTPYSLHMLFPPERVLVLLCDAFDIAYASENSIFKRAFLVQDAQKVSSFVRCPRFSKVGQFDLF